MGATAQNTTNTVKPFSGSKDFTKFSVGINAGALRSSVAIGGSNDYTKNLFRFGYGINLKYQFTHSIAAQADFTRGTLQGNQSKKQGTDSLNLDKPISSFNTDLNLAGSLSALYTFGNINWLRMKNWFVPYVGVGGGLANYNVKIVKKDDTNEIDYPYGVKNDITEFYVPVSVGVRIKLTRMINLDIGYRMHFTDGDNLDGFSYYNVPHDYANTLKKDKFSYTHAGIEIALGKKSKSQLLFDNPGARVNEIMQTQVSSLATKVDSLIARQKSLDDTDGDGVADLYDKEANTPDGCPVDAQGVMRDTDGDGVVDCKDKQLITPTECQPVDADGVGKCPDPECCQTRPGGGGDGDGDALNCPADYPSLTFRGNSPRVSGDNQSMIATVAAKMKSRPDCKVVIKGYPETSKSSQAVCQRRVDAIRLQLIEREGISADRITTNCEVGGGDKNTIDITSN